MTMASQITQENSADYIKAVEVEITENARLLRESLTKVLKISLDAELGTIKNNIWYKLCRPCRSKTLELSRNQLNCDKTVQQNEVVYHPLSNEDDIEIYKEKIKTLEYRIKKRDEKLKSMDHKSMSKSTITTDSSSDTDPQENIDMLTIELDETVGDILKLKKKVEEYLKEIKELNSTVDKLKWKVKNENNGHGGDISRVTTKGHTAQIEEDLSLTECFKKDIHGGESEVVSRTEARSGVKESEDQRELINQEIRELQQKLDRSAQELDEKQRIISGVQKENEDMSREISELQTEKLMLQDAIMVTNEFVKTVQESLNQDFNNKLEEMKNDLGKIREENKQNQRKVSKLQTEKQSLLDTLTKTKENESSISEKLQREVDSLTGELEKAKNDHEKAQGEREVYKNEIFEQQAEKQTLTDTLKRTEGYMSSKTERLQQDVDRLMKELEETKSDLEKHQEFIKGYEKDISDQQAEKQTLNDSFSRSRDEMRSTNERLQQEVELLTHELEQKNEDFDKAQGYLRDVSELQTQKQTLEDTLTRTKDDMSSATERMQQEIDRLTAELERKNEELHSAHEENRRLKRKVLVMRLLRSGGIGKAMADIVTKDITRWLDGRFDSRYVDFSAVHGETTASVLPGVLFVMCMNQPNQIVKHIQDAVLLGTKDGRDVYVLVISNTTKENLAQMTPTRDRVSSELQPSGGIIDMAFSSVDGGLYECDLNKSAINRIETILHKI